MTASFNFNFTIKVKKVNIDIVRKDTAALKGVLWQDQVCRRRKYCWL